MNSLLFAIPGIGNVLLVCMVFWLIFSIVGVQFFGGRFYKCVDGQGERLPISIVQNRTDCDRLGYRWINSNINFDNAGNGFIALFQVVSLFCFVRLGCLSIYGYTATQISFDLSKDPLSPGLSHRFRQRSSQKIFPRITLSLRGFPTD